MDKEDSDSNGKGSPSDPVKFIIMDSQYESEDPDIMHLPALQQSKVQSQRGKDSQSKILENLTRTTIEQKSVNVLVSDSEYDSHGKSSKRRSANSSSDSVIMIVESEDQSVAESEDQMEVTVIERKAESSKGVEKEEKSDSGSSIISSSKQDLGKYATAEMSHTQGAKLRGHMFPKSIDPSEVDLFPDDEVITATPAEHIGSLHLSQPMLVPETVDDDMFAVSPSQDNFPHIIPDSPTNVCNEAEEEYDPTAEQTLSDQNVDFNGTVVRNISQKSNKSRSATQESFHLHFSCTEYSPKQTEEEASVQVLEKSEDVIVISQDGEQEDQGLSQEFMLHLSQSQSTQRGSKSIDSKSQSSEGFHIKLPREDDPLLSSQNQFDKDVVQVENKQISQSKQVSSQGQHDQEEDMVTQTPQYFPRQQTSQEYVDKFTSEREENTFSQKTDKSFSQRIEGSQQRTPLKHPPSLSIEMITTESQVSEHSFKLNRPDVHVGSEQSPQEDTRTDVFRKIKSSDKSTSRYQIHDDSDEEVSFKTVEGKEEKEKDKNLDEEKEDTPPKLKMIRTISSEVTSTGYQGSIESLQSSAHPRETSKQPEDTTAQPEDATAQSEDTTGQPGYTTGQPGYTTGQPGYTTGNQGYTTDSTRDTTIQQGDTIVEPQDNTSTHSVDINLHPSGDASSHPNNSMLDVDKTQSYDTEKYLKIAENSKDNIEILTTEKDVYALNESTVDNDKIVSVDNKNLQNVDVSRKSPQVSSQKTPSQNSSTQEEQLKNVKKNSKTVTVKTAKSFKEINVNVRNNGSGRETCNKEPELTGAQHDPYEFHGSQSQITEDIEMKKPDESKVNPVEYYRTRRIPTQPGETPPSSRKRKRKVHKKTGLKKKPAKKSATEHHVCFSSPVTESLTTPPSQTISAKNLSSLSEKSELSKYPAALGSIPTRTGQQISSIYSPPQDRIEEDFQNPNTPVTVLREPIVADQQHSPTTSTDMGPPTSVPLSARSPTTLTVVSALSTVTTPSTTAGMLTRTETTPSTTAGMLTRTETLVLPESGSQLEPGQDVQDDIRIKTVTTTLVTYKIVETVEKIKFKNGTVKVLSQHTEKIPIKTLQKKTETTEEYIMSPMSPSKTNSTVTSGDLGDISSSLSRSGSSGPNSLDVNRLGSEVVVSQSLESAVSRNILLLREQVTASPRDIHHVSGSETYSPLEVSSIHRDVDRRLSSENLFTSPDTSKGEEEVKRIETGSLSDAITCAQRKIVTEPVQRSGEESEPLFILPKPTTTGSSAESNEISPEIPYQDQAISTTKPDKQDDKNVEVTSKEIDARIMAKWKDTHFYPGVIKEVLGKSRYKVRFDDGDVLVIKGCDILLIDKLPVSQPVMVLSKDGYFYPGTITEETEKGNVIQYTVLQGNGQSAKFRSSQVILSEDQAACLIADLQCRLGDQSEDTEEPTVHNANVSLENLVMGKRRKESRYEQLNMSTEEPKPGPSSKKKSKTPFSPTPGKRKKISGPSTSTPRVAKRRKIAEDAETESTTAPSGDTSPISHRKSPRKGKGPAKSPQKLFQGMYFMFTQVKKTTDIVAREKEMLRDSAQETSAEESGPDDEGKVPFDKDFLKSQITREGGIILHTINNSFLQNNSSMFLISNSYVRTVKYFQALAAGYPCVSHRWIIDSVSQQTLLDYKSYMLQAGISIEKKKKVEWNAHRGDLKDMTVMLEGENLAEWSNILEIAGANLVKKLHSRRATDEIVQVVVTDNSCKPQILRSARTLRTPVVSTEWLIQCLINGHLMDFTGHPMYEYDYTDSQVI
ncbi:TP53-binding protein 1-like [Mytilus trossulus]|uniref:TP53-binding protein 1-like n=1 Tax=Mytilus trossulus TaxID=6551 RepID=UPI003007F1CD